MESLHLVTKSPTLSVIGIHLVRPFPTLMIPPTLDVVVLNGQVFAWMQKVTCVKQITARLDF